MVIIGFLSHYEENKCPEFDRSNETVWVLSNTDKKQILLRADSLEIQGDTLSAWVLRNVCKSPNK